MTLLDSPRGAAERPDDLSLLEEDYAGVLWTRIPYGLSAAQYAARLRGPHIAALLRCYRDGWLSMYADEVSWGEAPLPDHDAVNALEDLDLLEPAAAPRGRWHYLLTDLGYHTALALGAAALDADDHGRGWHLLAS